MPILHSVQDERTRDYNPYWPEGQKAQYCYLGPLTIPTGYSQATREHLKALARAGLPICGKDTSRLGFLLQKEVIADDHELNNISDDRPEYSGPFEGFILHQTCDRLRHMGAPTGALVVWETEGLPPGWGDKANEMDFLFTPSEFSKRLFIEGGVTKPIHVIPHPIDVMLFNPDVPPVQPPSWVPGIPGGRLQEIGRPETVFLCVAQYMPRKGIDDLLVAYLTEFTAEDSVALMLMVWGGSHSLAERGRVKLQIQQVREGLNLPHDPPPIWFVGERVGRLNIPQIYTLADVFVLPSYGESFSIPIFEAAACARPSISTGYGGQWDYLDDSSAYRVDYELEPPRGVGGPWRFYNGTQLWARPKIMHLREQMRRAHENKAERVEMGQRALEVVVQRMTHDKVGAEMKEKFLEHIPSKVGV